jgi:hypothetical protein
MPHALRAAALLGCLLLLPVSATAALTAFDFSGTVTSLSNGFDMLDASVSDGSTPGAPAATTVSGTYQVDPTSEDKATPFGVGLAHLSFQLGGYLFQATQTSHTIALEDETGAEGFEVDRWQSRAMLDSDLTPLTSNHGPGFAGYVAQIEFYDFERDVFDGTETAPFVPDAVDFPWNQARLTLNSVDGSLIYDNRVKVEVNITRWTEVPESRSAVLLALGLASIAWRERKRVRAR